MRCDKELQQMKNLEESIDKDNKKKCAESVKLPAMPDVFVTDVDQIEPTKSDKSDHYKRVKV